MKHIKEVRRMSTDNLWVVVGDPCKLITLRADALANIVARNGGDPVAVDRFVELVGPNPKLLTMGVN